MAAWTLSPRAETVLRRHVPPAQVPVLKNSAFDLMTRSAFIAQVPADATTPADCDSERLRPPECAIQPIAVR